MRTICIQRLGQNTTARISASHSALRPGQQQLLSYSGIEDDSYLGRPDGQADSFVSVHEDKTDRLGSGQDDYSDRVLERDI